MDYEIQHQPEQSRFVLIKGSHECVLDYVITDRQLDFTHTYVPFRLRGQGLAEVLVEHGLSWAKKEGYRLQASCWYVQKFL